MLSKTLKTRLTLLGTLAVMLGTSANARAEYGLAGSHKSKDQKVDLIVKSLADDGRDGSYLGVLISYRDKEHPRKIAVYLIDPSPVDNVYVMIPRKVTEDGMVIGSRNPNGCLTMNPDGYSNGSVTFKIVGTGNPGCSDFQDFTGVFDGKSRSKFSWTEFVGGKYVVAGDKDRNLRLGDDHGDRLVAGQTGITANLQDLNGNFVFRNEYPGLFTVQRLRIAATGAEQAPAPSKIGLFLNSGGRNDGLFLIDPNNYENVYRLDRK